MQVFKSVEVRVNVGLVFIHYILSVIVQVNENKPEPLESISLYRSTIQNLRNGWKFEPWK